MAKPTLLPATVRAAVSDVFGGITDFRPITEGEESQAFAVIVGDDPMVVRVNGHAQGFHKDRWVADRVAGTVPVPDVMHIGHIGEGHHICVSTQMPGVVIQDCDASTVDRLQVAIARVLDDIAATEVSDIQGFGDFDPLTRTGKFGSWASYVLHATRHDWTAYGNHINVDAANRLTAWLRDNAAELPDFHELVHGDFGGDNVLVEPGRVTAVIDWEAAIIGDSLFDLARMRFWAPFMDSMRLLTNHCLSTDHDPHRLRCYVIATGLDAVAYYAAAGQGPIAHAMLERTLREL